MFIKYFCFLFLMIINFFNMHGKESLCHAESRIDKVRFKTRDGFVVFTQKYQNLNGEVLHFYYMNDSDIPRDNYLQLVLRAEKEEEVLLKEEQELKLKEEEAKRKALIAKQEKERQEFLNKMRIQTLKRLVSLELEKVEQSLFKLDKYDLQDYFVYQVATFENHQHFFDVKNNLVNQAKQLSIKTVDELQEDQLKDLLARLEEVPGRVEQFFRESVKYAVDKCNDTKRLKELLTLI